MRRQLDDQLSELNNEMIEMGALCEEAIALAATALSEGDIEIAAKVAPLDLRIDEKERLIEGLCTRILMQQQPVASDLRQITAAYKMVTDMERIGDQAEDIAEIVVYLGGRTAEEHYNIRKMAEATIKMVTESVDAYVKRDIDLAEAVIAYDDVVDDYFETVKNNLINMIADNPSEGSFALDLLMIAKYFERIGDHAVNIAEWVAYTVAGMIREIDS